MELTIEEVFQAYYDCRKNKRYSYGALQFESDYESNVVQLYYELKSGTWSPRPSTCFIVTRPVRREIFAASFRDRIVHHLLINRLNPSFEKYFIHDSYACRVNKGTHAAIARVEHFIRSESDNGKKKAYVLKTDIQSFFMSIDRNVLYSLLCNFLDSIYRKTVSCGSVEFEKKLCRIIIFNDPCASCIRKSPPSAWNELPKQKSLFYTAQGCGLPIGNLTSQVFANFYVSIFDHFVKHTLRVKNYVRYVDDCVIVSTSQTYLRLLVPIMKIFLQTQLHVCLHPKKIYLQEVSHGVEFLGCFIKPAYTVCSRRIKNNFEHALKSLQLLSYDHKPRKDELDMFRATVNSYLGIMAHYSMFQFKTALLHRYMIPYWNKYFVIAEHADKVKV